MGRLKQSGTTVGKGWLRHANSCISLDLYAQAGMPNKRFGTKQTCSAGIQQGRSTGLTGPNWTMAGIADSLEVSERNGGDDETRTRDLCRDSSNSLVTDCKTATRVAPKGSFRAAGNNCWTIIWTKTIRPQPPLAGLLLVCRQDWHRGGGHPPTPATPPCVRVRTRRFELVTLASVDQRWKSERFEVSIGKPHREGFGPGQIPGAESAASRIVGEARTHS
jgi:hypothetical protein